MATTKSTKNITDLVNDLKNPVLFNKMGPGLSLIKPGNWQGMVKWAGSFGYTISIQDIKTFLASHPSILKAFSQSPALENWNMETLTTAAASS